MKIACLAGDGIGPEIMAEARRVLAALDLPGLTVWEGDVGGIGYKRHGHPLPPETLEMAKAADAAGIQWRRLNASKGPAVRATRCQADRAEQHGIGGLGHLERLGRKRVAMAVVADPADVAFPYRQPGQVERGEHAARFGHDLGTDPVACQYRDLHAIRPNRSRKRARAAITSPRRSASK